eukprot:1160736-Pelagomonas_calceolata.AAC.11
MQRTGPPSAGRQPSCHRLGNAWAKLGATAWPHPCARRGHAVLLCIVPILARVLKDVLTRPGLKHTQPRPAS